MRRSSAFYRLADRPWGLGFVAIVIFAGPAIMTLFFGGSLKEAFEMLRGIGGFLSLRKSPLPAHLLMTYPFIAFYAGLSVGGISARARKTWMGWTLPGLRRGLVTGNLQVMAAGIALTMFVSGGATMRSLAAAGIAAVLYAIGLGGATWMRRPTFGLCVVLLWMIGLMGKLPTYLRPDVLFDALVSINALLVAVLTIAAATWLVLRGLSPELHRREIPGLEAASDNPV